MVDDDEWAWIVERSRADVDHLLIASTLPVFMLPGVHHLEAWSESVCHGAWGRPAAWVGEHIRRALDLEHWPAFHTSFVRMIDLLRDVATGGGGERRPPASVSVIGGDVHNAYVAEVSLGRRDPARSRVTRSCARRSGIRYPLGAVDGEADQDPTRRRLPADAAHLAGVRMPGRAVAVEHEPTFENSIGIVELDGRRAEVTIFRAEPGDPAGALQPLHSHVLSDGPRADCRRRLSRRGLDGLSEVEQPPAERDRAGGEPAPPEGEAGDDVGRPVQIEHHPAAGHRDGEPDRGTRERRPRRAVRRRPASSASAAKNAAAVDECPLGNDGPSVAATGSIVGRARATISLTVFVTSESPRVTTSRNAGIQRLRTRIHSATPATTPITRTPWVVARVVTSSSRR